MPRLLILRPEAELEAEAAYDWYDEQESGLGDEFLRCLDACLSKIKRNPEIYAVACEGWRRALLRRFPYAVFYEHIDETIIVHSIFHCAQNPDKWRERLR